jgi:hypothetical protein
MDKCEVWFDCTIPCSKKLVDREHGRERERESTVIEREHDGNDRQEGWYR